MSTLNKIGTRNESSLHRTLKFKYAGKGGKTEVPAGEYVADGISKSGEYIEVQTGSFGPLKKKVDEFVKYGKVRIIHPIAANKIIEVYEPAKRKKRNAAVSIYGKLLHRRKSPKKGSQWDLFDALLYAPLLPLNRRVTIEIVMLDITEKRIKDGKGSWRRKGISIKDRELAAWRESIILKKKSDYMRFVPFKKKEEFTTALFAKRAGINISTARKVLYVLTKIKFVTRTGKKGQSYIYIR